MSDALKDKCETESSEDPGGRESRYGQKVYERLRSGEGLFTADQLEALVTALLQSHPSNRNDTN